MRARLKAKKKNTKKVSPARTRKCVVVGRARRSGRLFLTKAAKKKACTAGNSLTPKRTASSATRPDRLLERFESGESIADFIDFSKGRHVVIP